MSAREEIRDEQLPECFCKDGSPTRGLPQEVVSDRGTNCISANRELKELVEKLDKGKICQRTANQGVTWIFNPLQEPHFGGAHEIMIKAAKKAIHTVLRKANVTDEELMTAFIGLYYLSSIQDR